MAKNRVTKGNFSEYGVRTLSEEELCKVRGGSDAFLGSGDVAVKTWSRSFDETTTQFTYDLSGNLLTIR